MCERPTGNGKGKCLQRILCCAGEYDLARSVCELDGWVGGWVVSFSGRRAGRKNYNQLTNTQGTGPEGEGEQTHVCFDVTA